MANQADPEAEFQSELQAFENDIDEVVQCFYIWRTVHAEARKRKRVYDLLNRNAGFWNVALGSIQANSLIALGRIFDHSHDSHNLNVFSSSSKEIPRSSPKQHCESARKRI